MNINKKPYPNIGQGFLVILTTLGYSALAYLLAYLVFKIAGWKENIEWLTSLENLIVYVVGIGLAVLTAVILRKQSGLRFSPSLRLPSIIIIVISVVAIICIGYLLELFTYMIPIPDFFMEIFEDAINPDILSFITLVIAAPVLEEILLRSVILDGFLKRYTPGKAIFWSAVIFGVLHLNPWQAIAGIASGLLLGWLYWKTKSLGLCILLHATNNCIAFLLFLSIGTEIPDLVTYMGTVNYFIGFAIILILLIGCMRFLNNHFKKHEPTEGNLPV